MMSNTPKCPKGNPQPPKGGFKYKIQLGLLVFKVPFRGFRGVGVFFFFFPFFLSAQNDTTIYRVIKAVEANEYLFRVPEDWKKVPQIENSPLDEKFEFTTVGLPLKVHDAPLTANLILRKLPADSIQAGETFIIKEFTSYPDRVTSAGENYETDSLIIASGEKATLIHTRYYRRSKVSNFTRYDLVAYSPKRKACYLLTITYQYKDPTYMVEADLKLRQYAIRVLKSLVLR